MKVCPTAHCLAHVCFFKLKNHGTGEDLVQETFLKTWAYLVRGGKIETMKAFLYHVLNNLIVDQYRKKKPVSLDAMIEKGFEPAADDSTQPPNLFSALDSKSALALIEQLPDCYKQVMRMRYVQDLSLGEISLATGKSKNAISVQSHRGIEKLKILYKPELS